MIQLDMYVDEYGKKFSDQLSDIIVMLEEGASDEKRMALSSLENIRVKFERGELLVVNPEIKGNIE